MVDSNIVTGQSDQVDLHHQSSLNSIKCVYPLIIITSSSTAGRLISGFVCLFLFQISFANELKKYCKEKMPFTVLTASHTGSLLKMFFFFLKKKLQHLRSKKSLARGDPFTEVQTRENFVVSKRWSIGREAVDAHGVQ